MSREEMRKTEMTWEEMGTVEINWEELGWAEKRREDVRWDEMRWGEMRWGEVKKVEKTRHDMRWDDAMGLDKMRWDEMRLNKMRWDEMRWDEVRWADMRWDQMMRRNEQWKEMSQEWYVKTCQEIFAAKHRRLAHTLQAHSLFRSLGYRRFNFQTSAPGLPGYYLQRQPQKWGGQWSGAKAILIMYDWERHLGVSANKHQRTNWWFYHQECGYVTDKYLGLSRNSGDETNQCNAATRDYKQIHHVGGISWKYNGVRICMTTKTWLIMIQSTIWHDMHLPREQDGATTSIIFHHPRVKNMEHGWTQVFQWVPYWASWPQDLFKPGAAAGKKRLEEAAGSWNRGASCHVSWWIPVYVAYIHTHTHIYIYIYDMYMHI